MTTTDALLPGQTPEGKKLRDTLDMMDKAATMAIERLSSGDGTIKVWDAETAAKNNAAGAPTKLDQMNDEQRAAIARKVEMFLDPKLQGPIFTCVLRDKLFVGKYPKRQNILDVQASMKRKSTDLTMAQANIGLIGELLESLRDGGWVPAHGNRAAMLRATIDDPSKWPVLEPVEWLNTRDPYVWDDEAFPMWDLYQAWMETVTPTRDEIHFYYSLKQ